MDFPHIGPVMHKTFPFGDVIMIISRPTIWSCGGLHVVNTIINICFKISISNLTQSVLISMTSSLLISTLKYNIFNFSISISAHLHINFANDENSINKDRNRQFWDISIFGVWLNRLYEICWHWFMDCIIVQGLVNIWIDRVPKSCCCMAICGIRELIFSCASD